MTIRQEHERVQAGRSLEDFENQAGQAIARLAGIKVNLVALRNAVQASVDAADGKFTVDDKAEVQAVIDKIVADIAAL